MKHLLNDMSFREKNSILEQYHGGKSIDTSKFKRLLESQLGNVKPLIVEGKNKDKVVAAFEEAKTDPECKKNPELDYCGTKGKIVYDYINKQGMAGMGTDEDLILGAIYAVSDKNIYNELVAQVKKKQNKDLMCWIQTEMPVNDYETSTRTYGNEDPRSPFQQIQYYTTGEAGGNRSYINKMIEHLKQFDPTISDCRETVDLWGS